LLKIIKIDWTGSQL